MTIKDPLHFRKLEIRTALFFFFPLFRATPVAYGGSQAKDRIQAAAAGLQYHSHRHTGSEPHLEPTQQLTAMPDP